ncbi:MAG: NADPH-dependent F420 reductase [Candidatus Thiodiazotropha sp.]|nr:NADPH-dependent F420 reductase [Candidatus Thiodiazotropha sp.]MCM8884623.1 NADPH-dependent F420 reductase [Candidatus Thiodiazotropha sp.]MCM8922002.1 NADPH-dependent F420 reductase [Candidatus Thiodiazotropha sp.]
MSDSLPIVAVLGGTGDLGGGLAYQLAKAGYPVIIGSRGEEKARDSAKALSERVGTSVDGRENSMAATIAEVVIMTVPFASHEGTLKSVRDAVQGKIFVDATVPLVPPKVARVQLPADGPAAKQSQSFLGENVRVVSAFQNIAAAHLQSDDGHHNDCDVLVSGNDPEAREVVVKLAQDVGLRAWHAGAIDNSVVAEAMTSVLIFLNKRYKINGAGLRITGEPGSAG